MKTKGSIFVFLALLAFLVAACGGAAGPTTTSGGSPTSTSSTSNTVGLTSTNFAQSSITIKKGQSITLMNQTSTVHIISNGSWQGNTPHPKQEPDAPVVTNMTFNTVNQTKTIGPFNTAGTFHYYCSVHVGMNLTVIVQ